MTTTSFDSSIRIQKLNWHLDKNKNKTKLGLAVKVRSVYRYLFNKSIQCFSYIDIRNVVYGFSIIPKIPKIAIFFAFF